MRLSFWRKIRLCIRWLRRAALAGLVVLITALLWFNQIGLPDFVKKPLVEKLRSRGVNLEFVRLRLHLTGGVVAENVRIGDVNIPDTPTLVLAEIQLQPDFRALWHGQLQLEGLGLRQGRIIWRFSPTNLLSVENINSELRFGTNDTWSLDNFGAGFAGAKFTLAGNIIHASELRNWDVFQGKKGGNMAWRLQAQKLSDALAKSHPHPQLTLGINGDARDANSFMVNLAVTRGKTRLQLDGRDDEAIQNFSWRIHGALEPDIIRPFLFTTNVIRVFSRLTFIEPVYVDGNIYGRLDRLDSIGASGSVTATNFAVRGEAIGRCSADFTYTNHVLEFLTPQVSRGEQKMSADKVILNFDRKLVWVINGFSTADPHSVARAIGPKVGKILEPYHFDSMPAVRVNGCAPLHDVGGLHDAADADLSFDVLNGQNFQCLKLHAQTITGTVHWLRNTLILTNVVAQLYGGSGNGYAFFDFDAPHEGADYQFAANVSNVNIHELATDLSSPVNHLEGRLSGRVMVTNGRTDNWRAMDGFGHAQLRDGLLWDIQIFGFLSPVLNTLVPSANLGNSRATDASAHFQMTNGVIYSDSLEIKSAMLMLKYDGKVDLNGNVNAHVAGEPFGGIPFIGPLVNAVFWPVGKLLEYKITGSLKNPKVSPMHVPKELMPGRDGAKPARPESFSITNAPALEGSTNAPPDLP